MKWPEVTLSKVADINPSRPRDLGIRDNQSVSFVPMPAVSEQTAAIEHPDTRPYVDVKKGFTYFEENDVLFAKITPCMENGKSAIASGLIGGVGFGSTEFHVIRSNQSFLLPKYVHYFIRQQSFRDNAKARMRGAVGQQRVPKDFLDDTMVPLPSISEQRRIVEILDQADQLRKLRADANAIAQRILPALFIKMFGDPTTNPKKFPIASLGDPGITEINPKLDKNSYPGDTKVTFLPMADVDHILGQIKGDQVKRLIDVKKGFTPFSNGDVLFAKITPCMQNGKSAIAKNLVNNLGFGSTEFHVIRPGRKTTAEWVFALIRMSFFRKHAENSFTGSAGQQRVPEIFIKNYKIPIPPIEKQIRFSKQFEKLSMQMEKTKKNEKLLQNFFNIILHRSFTGDLTASWREAHMKELLQEMELQAKALAS